MIDCPTVHNNNATVIYAFGHLLTDYLCASFMLRTLPSPWLFLAYNFCAFALQMPIGLLADILGKNHSFSLCGIFLVLLSLFPSPTVLRVILIGTGNACYHVGGGHNALMADKHMIRLGIFVSPGALGICFGSLLCKNLFLFHIAAVLLGLTALYICIFCKDRHSVKSTGKAKPSPLILMLSVVILRSALGLSMQTPWKVGIYIILAGISSAVGKALGGWLADHFGGKRTGAFTLLVSAILFCFPDSGVVGVIAILLFNMTMPITLRKASDALPGMEGFAFGILTFGLFLGYLPSFLGISFPWWLCSAMTILSALLMWLSEERDNA